MRIDLHTHSRHSDGTDRPAQLVRAAATAGLDVVALTDHDATTGWAEAAREADEVGIGLVPGIEVSCSHRGVSVHLLAYLADPQHPALAAELRAAREHRLSRLEVMVDRLAADGYPVSYADVMAQAQDGATLGRPHLADALVDAGRYPDRAAAFADVLHNASPYYVAHYAPAPARAVELVLAAGGVPVMAHPFAGARGRTVGEDVIAQLVAAGLQGVEVYHRDHDEAATRRALAFAGAHGLLVTGSSDYHGAGKPNRLGEHTTEPEVLAQILKRGTGVPVSGQWAHLP